MMRDEANSQPHSAIAATLDGMPVKLPSNRDSLNAIRCFLEALALKNQRILHTLCVDGELVNLAAPMIHRGEFSRIAAETSALEDTSVLLLETALQQIAHTRECVETAVTLVLINDMRTAREIWWNLAGQLKEPVLLLSLLPENLCGQADGGTSPAQLRKWQLEQIGGIIRRIDQSCQSGDTIELSNALENLALPWLQKLSELIGLWRETILAGLRLGIKHGAL
jgi:hypothetical protein